MYTAGLSVIICITYSAILIVYSKQIINNYNSPICNDVYIPSLGIVIVVAQVFHIAVIIITAFYVVMRFCSRHVNILYWPVQILFVSISIFVVASYSSLCHFGYTTTITDLFIYGILFACVVITIFSILLCLSFLIEHSYYTCRGNINDRNLLMQTINMVINIIIASSCKSFITNHDNNQVIPIGNNIISISVTVTQSNSEQLSNSVIQDM